MAAKRRKVAKKSTTRRVSPERAQRCARQLVLLAFIATNNDFRKRLKKDPVGTLAQIGLEVPSEELPEVIRLPSKKEALSRLSKFGFMRAWKRDFLAEDFLRGKVRAVKP